MTVDGFRLAFDESWRWAERRGVRIEYWRNDDGAWEAQVILRDTNGDFYASQVLPIHNPTKAERRKHTVDELRTAYVKQLRSLLDGATASARSQRITWQRRRLQ